MKKQNCKEICELLSSYLDNALSSEEKKKLEAHLSSCEYCTDEYQLLMEMKKVMEEIKDEEISAPEGFVNSVMNQIEKEKTVTEVKEDQQTPGIVSRLVDKVFKKPWIPVLIAAMFLVVLYVPGQFGPMLSSDSSFTEGSDMMSQEMGPEPGMTRSAAPEMTTNNIVATSAEEEFQDREALIDTDRKIIRNAAMSMEITNYSETEEAISRQAETFGGFISSSNSYYYGEENDLLAGFMSLRVPEEHFNEIITYIEDAGRVTHKNTWSNDVTEMYMDMETQIRNLEIKEDRLLAILEQQGSLQDLLAVENEIAQTRSEIERLTGRLNLLQNQVAFSTIEIELREVRSLDESITRDGFSNLGTRMKEALIRSINLLIDLSVRGLLLITGVLPFAVIAVLLGFGGYKIWQKRKKEE